MLTQDHVRGDSVERHSVRARRRQPAAEDLSVSTALSGRRQVATDDVIVSSTSAAVSGRSALNRSATSITPADTRLKSLLPVFAAADTAAASTWLDDARNHQPDDRLDTRSSLYEQAHTQTQTQSTDSASRLRDTAQQYDDYDFHFGIASTSSSTSSSQQQPAAVSSSSRPVALVQPHKVTGVRVMPAELNASLISWSQGKPTKTAASSAQPQSTQSEMAQQQDVSRVKNKEEQRVTAPTSLREQLKATSSTTSTPPPVTKRRDLNTSTPSAATRPTSDSSSAAKLTSKDKEIATAIGDMRLDYDSSQNTLSAHGTNFEKCLGYFP